MLSIVVLHSVNESSSKQELNTKFYITITLSSMSLVDASTDDKYFNSQAWPRTVCNGIKPNKSGLDGSAEGML